MSLSELHLRYVMAILHFGDRNHLDSDGRKEFCKRVAPRNRTIVGELMDFTTPSYYGIFLPVILLIAFNLRRKSLRSETISLLLFSYIFFWYFQAGMYCYS